MRDVVFVAVTVGFFGLAGLFVRGCAWIVGDDGPPTQPADRADDQLVEAMP